MYLVKLDILDLMPEIAIMADKIKSQVFMIQIEFIEFLLMSSLHRHHIFFGE